MALKTTFPTVLLLFLVAQACRAQSSDSLQAGDKARFFSIQPARSFQKDRFWATAGTGAAVYTGLSVALWKAWYQDYPLTDFHFFNDLGEWNDIDKSGHLFSAYTGCTYSFRGARWTGMSRRQAMWASAGIGMGIMLTFETMDGFSQEWGFSLGDLGFNTAGVGLFIGQEMLWKEQRIVMKLSGHRPDYPTAPLHSADGNALTSLDQRAAELYGTSPFHVLLKDYNAITVWSSFNLRSFLRNQPSSRFPAWLNLAVGYGAENLYGGDDNIWETENGATFSVDPQRYPRYRQFFLSPDIDWTKVPTRHKWLKFTLGLFNWLKLPAPAFELNTLGKTKFHYLHW